MCLNLFIYFDCLLLASCLIRLLRFPKDKGVLIFTPQSHPYLLLPVSQTGEAVGADRACCLGHPAQIWGCVSEKQHLTQAIFYLVSATECSIAEKVMHFEKESHASHRTKFLSLKREKAILRHIQCALSGGTTNKASTVGSRSCR